MDKEEKAILDAMAHAIPEMTEFEKGYFLGVAESKVEAKKNMEKEPELAAV